MPGIPPISPVPRIPPELPRREPDAPARKKKPAPKKTPSLPPAAPPDPGTYPDLRKPKKLMQDIVGRIIDLLS